VKLNILSIATDLDTFFATPRPFSPQLPTDLAAILQEGFAPHQFDAGSLSASDTSKLLDYRIQFSLFNGVAKFEWTGKGVSARVTEGRTRDDAAVMGALLVRLHSCLAKHVTTKLAMTTSIRGTVRCIAEGVTSADLLRSSCSSLVKSRIVAATFDGIHAEGFSSFQFRIDPWYAQPEQILVTVTALTSDFVGQTHLESLLKAMSEGAEMTGMELVYS
jgi:hypothetical protein